MTSQYDSLLCRLSRFLPVIVILIACLIAVGPAVFSGTESRTLRRAVNAANRREFAEAEQLARSVLERNPQSYLAAVIAGDAASDQHLHEQAIAYYARVPEHAGDLAILARLGLGERWYVLGSIADAEKSFRFVLDRWPDNSHANQRYAHLMQVQGRSWESVEPAMRLIQLGVVGIKEIDLVSCPENRFIRDTHLLELCSQSHPDDPGPMLADARLAFLEHQYGQAEQLYEQVLISDPTIVEPYIQLGRIYLDSNRASDFVELNRRLPTKGESHARVWINRGLCGLQFGNHESAARCLYEALIRSPNHVEANYLMSQVLVQLGDITQADEFGERAKTLARIELTIPEFDDEPANERMQALIADFDSLGRYWEAAAICQYAMEQMQPPAWAAGRLSEFSSKLRTGATQGSGQRILMPVRHVADFDRPDWSSQQPDIGNEHVRQPDALAIRFEDRATEAGLDFEYFNGSVGTRGMEHIFETTGGGTIALDYDQDLWPDLYLTQGAAIWEGDDPVPSIDRLFRNTGRGFADTTAGAYLGDDSFSQGATVGDFNNDGFADLYVCNLTQNRFYENNGDGTFSEISVATGTAGDEWSLSSVLVDLNGDANPDLYVVNYLERASVFDRRCKRNGQPLTCAPTLFPAEQDRVYLSLGDGRFREITETCGVVQAEGKGLAILAADLNQSGRISLFIGNDTTPNFLFVNETQPDGSIEFDEAGIISGLALDGAGRSQATMGIAFGDLNDSGRGDIFITNFYADSNTLYFQGAPGQFVDSTRQSGLREPSLTMLGFGTELVDADLDGRQDLFVTNGHVDRTFATGEPDEMLPQFFYNFGRGQFQVLDGPVVGRFFEGRYLGRSVSRLDWNRDGLDDLCVLHLYSPVALVTNESADVGHSIRFRLRGAEIDRDAIGTTIQIEAGERSWTHQLVAGDGYMTSNEKVLTVGLGQLHNIQRLKVLWKDGSSQTFQDVEGDREYIVIQGREALLELPGEKTM